MKTGMRVKKMKTSESLKVVYDGGGERSEQDERRARSESLTAPRGLLFPSLQNLYFEHDFCIIWS